MSVPPVEPQPESDSGTAASTVSTTFLPQRPGTLLSALPFPTGVMSFLSEGEGLVGWGEYARFTTTGPDAADQIDRWWRELCQGLSGFDRATSTAKDPENRPSPGPIVFVSLGFSSTDESVAVVPRTVLGSREGYTYRTTIGSAQLLAPSDEVTSPGPISYADGDVSIGAYMSAVTRAVERIKAGEINKVVLARDLQAVAQKDIDQRYLLRQLADSYPTCWTFAVDGLIGATPEMLIRRDGRQISSRVLAGTAWPNRAGAHTSGTVATELLASAKDLQEHRYAVESVADVLARVSSDLRVPRQPHVLPLANLAHLVTDIIGELDSVDETPASALQIAARLHPSAAVGGTPTPAALRVIQELEPMRRGRYAAPVGWMDADGNGEFGIALRCAMVQGRTARMYAGCGIMGTSVPEIEAREAQVKMIPIRDALEPQVPDSPSSQALGS